MSASTNNQQRSHTNGPNRRPSAKKAQRGNHILLSFILGAFVLGGILYVRASERRAATEAPSSEPARSSEDRAGEPVASVPQPAPRSPAAAPRAPGVASFPFAGLNPKTLSRDEAKAVIEARPQEPPRQTNAARDLPPDLKQQLEGPPPELRDEVRAQLNSQPKQEDLPDDIKRALTTPPRIVTLDEVNNPALAIDPRDLPATGPSGPMEVPIAGE